jgi:hypothetical protein
MPDHYVANVGNRDLWLDGAPIPAEQCRQRGQEILADYDAYRDRLSAPILEAGLRYVLDHHTDGPGPLVHLFATNQSETAGPYRDKDTVDVARVLKRLLPERLRGSRVKLRTENRVRG